MPYETQDGLPTLASNSTPGSGVGTGSIEIQDEGSVIASVSKINFQGKDVSVINQSSLSRVTIDVAREDVFQFSCYKEGLADNIWLKSEEDLYLNVSPFKIAFDAELFGIYVTVKDSSSFDIEIYKNADIIPIPNTFDAVRIFNISGVSVFGTSGLSDSFVDGDSIGVYLRGSVENPKVTLFLRRI